MRIGRRLAIKILNASKFALSPGTAPASPKPEAKAGGPITCPVDRAIIRTLAALVDHGDDHHRDPGDAGIGLRRGEEIPAVDSRQKHVEGDGEGLDPASKLERLLSHFDRAL